MVVFPRSAAASLLSFSNSMLLMLLQIVICKLNLDEENGRSKASQRCIHFGDANGKPVCIPIFVRLWKIQNFPYETTVFMIKIDISA